MKLRTDMMLGAMGLITRAVSGAPVRRDDDDNRQQPEPQLYATTLGGFPADVDYFNGTTTANATAKIAIPASGALDLAFTASHRHLLVATGDAAGPNDISVIDTRPSSSTYNQVVGNFEINTNINGITVNRSDLVFVNPRNNWVFFAQQDFTPGPTALGAFNLDRLDDGQPDILPIEGVTISQPVSNQAAFTPDGEELWWPVTSQDGNGQVLIIDTHAHGRDSLEATTFNVGPNFFPAGIAITRENVYLTSSSGEFRVYDLRTHELLRNTTAGSGGAPNFVVASNDVERVYADTVAGNYLHVYAEDGSFLGETHLGGVGGSSDMKLSTNETQAFVSDTNGNLIQVVDLTQQPPQLVFAYSMPSPANLAVQGLIDGLDDDDDSDDED